MIYTSVKNIIYKFGSFINYNVILFREKFLFIKKSIILVVNFINKESLKLFFILEYQ